MTADDVMVVYDGHRLTVQPAPPDWWWDLLEALEDADQPT